MSTKFSEDVVPLTDVKVNPGKLVSQVAEAHRPVLLTSRERGVAVVQSVADFEAGGEERRFMKGVVQGLLDLEEGREINLAAVKKRLKLGRQHAGPTSVKSSTPHSASSIGGTRPG